MGKTKKTEIVDELEQTQMSPEQGELQSEQSIDKSEEAVMDESEITPKIDELLRLYPQYEKVWITKEGFVHPEGAPDYLLKNAVLYTNKYFNQ